MIRLVPFIPHAVLVVSLAVLAGGVSMNLLHQQSAEPIAFLSNASLPAGTPIEVHVAGEVAVPGVYQLRAGDRVADALDLAGGLTTSAAADDLNLARLLRDGEQLLVPAGRSSRSSNAQPAAQGRPININVATAAELDTLPGIGEAYSRRIVDSRLVDGPFTSVDDLTARKVLPASTLEKIRDLISVGP